MRRFRPLLLLAALAVAPSVGAAQTLLPLAPPAPDLARLVPFAEAPGEKPPLAPAAMPLPAAPADLPAFPLAAIVVPSDGKPTAPVVAPGALPCVGAFLGVASKAVECGRARFAKAEYEDAAKALEPVARDGEEREARVVLEARYWLAESYYVLGRSEQADRLFLQVAQTAPPRSEPGLWGAFGSGWTALRVGHAQRARDTFAQLLVGPVPPSMEEWARFGLGLASYALGRHPEALAAWTALAEGRGPRALARDHAFWLGEALGRAGEFDRAAAALARFVRGGAHPLLDQGWLRLGWWSLQGGRHGESVAAFRAFLTPTSPAAAPRVGVERDWAEAGLALALLASDLDAARQAARDLERRRSPLVAPLLVRFARTLLEGGKANEVQAIVPEVLAADLSPAARAYVLLLKGEAARALGNLDEARTQYELAQAGAPGTATAWFAGFRLAQANVELREFAQGLKDLGASAASATSPDARGDALLLQGEAAYYAGDQTTASAAFRRVLVEVPQHRDVAAARLGLAWSALRQDRADAARQEFLEFARRYPEHPSMPDALLLAAELALKNAGEWAEARGLLDRITREHASRPRTDFARLNLAILLLRTGEAGKARPLLVDWIQRAPFPPLVGRAHVALGVARLALGQPAEAGTSFGLAQSEGIGALATLGLGVVRLVQAEWASARELLTEARDSGTPAIATAAQYGLGVIAYQDGARTSFRAPAFAELAAAPQGPGAPRLLYVLCGIAVEERDWPAARDYAKRLAAEFPRDEAADDALERVGAGAAAAGVWPVASDVYAELQQRFPTSPFVAGARLTLAEAQVETGRAAAARPELETLVAAAPADRTSTRAWLVLARAREATGDPAGALDAYARAARDGRGGWGPQALLRNARLLLQDRKWADGRALLGGLLTSTDDTVVAEAAYAIGESWQGEGSELAAAEYFMTAAYIAPESPAGRRALLGAAASFLALKQPDAAAIVYRKLLDQPGVPAALAEAARKGLKELGR